MDISFVHILLEDKYCRSNSKITVAFKFIFALKYFDICNVVKES